MGTDDPLTRGSLDATEVERYRNEGFLILRGLLAAGDAEALAEETLAVLAARDREQTYLTQCGDYPAGSRLEGLIHSPRLRSVAGELLGGPAHVYMPFTAVKGAGREGFAFHQDNNYTPHDGPSCNCWFALRRCDAGNGALRIVPRSHLAGTVAAVPSGQDQHRTVAEQPRDWVEVELETGDCVVFTRNTVHASGPNGSDRPRVAYAVQFHREDVRAFFDGEWRPLVERPRWRVAPTDGPGPAGGPAAALT